MTDSQEENAPKDTGGAKPSPPLGQFRNPVDPAHSLEDGRKPWDWKSKYPEEARKLIDREAFIAAAYFAVFLLLTAFVAGLGTDTLVFEIGVKLTLVPSVLLTFSVGDLSP